jgi:hypothetical protein
MAIYFDFYEFEFFRFDYKNIFYLILENVLKIFFVSMVPLSFKEWPHVKYVCTEAYVYEK